MPDAGEVALRNGRKRVQWEGNVGLLVNGYRSGDKEREIVAGIVLQQRFNLPANDATDAGGLAHCRRVVDDDLHSPL